MGASFNPPVNLHSPGAIGDVTPGTVAASQAIAITLGFGPTRAVGFSSIGNNDVSMAGSGANLVTGAHTIQLHSDGTASIVFTDQVSFDPVNGGTTLMKGANDLIAIDGKTASFPGIKRVGTTIAIRLADDSGDGGLSTLSLVLNGGSTILGCLTAVATLDFPSALGLAAADLTMTVTGAAVGDVVDLGVPNASVPANASFFGWVSVANTVTIRYLPLVAGDPASGSFRALVWKF